MSNRAQQSIDDGSMTAIWALVDYGGGSADKKGPLPAVQSKKQTAPGMIRRPNEKPGQKVTEAEGNQRP
jgi:hypothetical protein